ncbi:DUF84 family protein [Candidatus Micrarchaeota archaeon]|jgi:non-canonical (house-cleaning) NTP pyrophosphatase|nr:DUF84 family protein [Candidatus Micrarchaeota archaeon]
MKIAVTSENKLKLKAVEKVYSEIGIKPKIIGFSADSNVGEQPVNETTLLGARNRIKYIKPKTKGFDRIISIENGIFREDNAWRDKAVIVLYNLKTKEEYIEYSDHIVFPDQYVDKAREIGFDKITVSKVMFDEGYILNAKDPHKTISGISRQVYLEDTLKKIIKKEEK